ncbi:MAG: hypothetical protein QM645_11130 [Asticcacaulis sp.]
MFATARYLLPSIALLAAPLLAVPAHAQDNDAPVATNVTGLRQQMIDTPILADAPADDFHRVAWCHGILSGHMDLAERLTDVEPASDMMRAIGRSYLRSYEAALTLSEEGKTEKGHQTAETARQKGFDGWEGARMADKDMAIGAYMNWSLPGDCERAAVALSGRPNLFKEMQTDEEAKIIAETLKPSTERTTLDVLTPKPAAQTPADNNQPVSSNLTDEVSEDRNWRQGLMSKLGWGKKD